ncbi:hypothetical protein [Streptomyces syringium]|uniref:hypothetical protein n=1 Tax=Streptomyces syringium TaxID=76729 RepID=UPI0037D0FE82
MASSSGRRPTPAQLTHRRRCWSPYERSGRHIGAPGCDECLQLATAITAAREMGDKVAEKLMKERIDTAHNAL